MQRGSKLNEPQGPRDFRTMYVTRVVLTVLLLYHAFAFVINFLIIFRKGALNFLVRNPCQKIGIIQFGIQ